MSEASKKPRLAGERRQRARERAQDLMSTGMSYNEVTRTIAGEFEVNINAAQKVIEEARKQWREQEGSRERDQHRDLHRAMALRIFKGALGRRRIEKAKGRPLRDEQGRYVTYPDPDYRTALRAAETLCRIDGTFQQRIELEAQGSIERFVDQVVEALEDDQETLEKLLPVLKGNG